MKCRARDSSQLLTESSLLYTNRGMNQIDTCCSLLLPMGTPYENGDVCCRKRRELLLSSKDPICSDVVVNLSVEFTEDWRLIR